MEQQAIDTGREPPALQKRPLPHEDLVSTWNAFQTLSRYRIIYEMGEVGPIPLSEVQAYMDIHEIAHGEDRAEFVELIGAMDDAYMAHALKKAQAKRGK